MLSGLRPILIDGAGHKNWLLPQLHQRTDVTVVDMRSYFAAPPPPR